MPDPVGHADAVLEYEIIGIVGHVLQLLVLGGVYGRVQPVEIAVTETEVRHFRNLVGVAA